MASVAPSRVKACASQAPTRSIRAAKELAAVRRGVRIAEPSREFVRLALSDLFRGETAPAPIVAVTESHFDFGVEAQRRGRLAGRALRGGQDLSVGA